ncbi:hypothetical protein E4U61_007081 [Claviceps capensis]|nr:hypothetical protein E4U61_007081 [Claviceps capensis]
MNSPEGRGRLSLQDQVERRPWTAEEDYLLIQLKGSHEGWNEIWDILPERSLGSCEWRYHVLRNKWERSELEETKNNIAMAYKRLKEDMWSQIAAEMSVRWTEVERIHWHLGKAQMSGSLMRNRDTNDSFRTTHANFPLPQVDDAQLQAPRQHQDQQLQGARRPCSDRTGDGETSLFPHRRSGMSQCDCYIDHSKQIATEPAWPQERKNELCTRYERLKRNMWSKIGDVLKIPWESVECIHWRLGAEGMAQRSEFMTERAGAAMIPLGAFRLAPPDEDHGEVHRHTDGERNQLSHHPQYPQYRTGPAPMAVMAPEGWAGSSVTLPSFDESPGVLPQRYT